MSETPLLSLCVPCMNRTEDLRVALPRIAAAANASPPCEIVVLNYSSPDDMDAYMQRIGDTLPLSAGNCLTYVRLDGKPYYSSPHARNLCVRAASGEYIIQLAADALPEENAIAVIRAAIEQHHPVWLSEYYHLGRFLVVRRDEFIAAGGYDERLKYYAPEDKDLSARLKRRGGKWAGFPADLISDIRTPYRMKLQNLDLREFEHVGQKKIAMARLMQPIYQRNVEDGVLVANPDGWGKWE